MFYFLLLFSPVLFYFALDSALNLEMIDINKIIDFVVVTELTLLHDVIIQFLTVAFVCSLLLPFFIRSKRLIRNITLNTIYLASFYIVGIIFYYLYLFASMNKMLEDELYYFISTSIFIIFMSISFILTRKFYLIAIDQYINFANSFDKFFKN